MAESEKEKLMRILKISAEEAEQIIADDKDIDKGKAKDFDLTPEELKVSMKMRHCIDRKKPTAYKWTKRERKPNPTKGAVITELAEFLSTESNNDCQDVVISNKERQIDFVIGDKHFSLTLVEHRKPKGVEVIKDL